MWLRSSVVPKPPESFEDDTFHKLEAAVRAIHLKEQAAHSQEELYRVGAYVVVAEVFCDLQRCRAWKVSAFTKGRLLCTSGSSSSAIVTSVP